MKTFILPPFRFPLGVLAAGVLLLFASVLSSPASVVFQDDFSGTTLGSDWTASTSGTSASVTVSDGNLNLLNQASSSTANARTALRSDFNFFDTPLTFNLSISDYYSTPASSSSAYFQLMLSSQSSTSPTLMPDVFGVRIRASNGILVAAKENDTSKSVFDASHVLNETTASSAITNISLTLDATHYSIVFTTASHGTIEFSGLHGLSEANWGDGSTAIALQQLTLSSPTSAGFLLNEIAVVAVPEPSVAGLLLIGAAGLAFVRRARKS